jgi:peptide/nickel transport system substrate-binding protein
MPSLSVRVWLTATLLAAGVWLWGTAGEERPSGTLRVVASGEVGGLDPTVGGLLFMRLQVTETLMDADDQGRPLPGLAAAWSATPDQLTWQFVLREGVTFHDGSLLDAEHVARMLERARRPPAALSLAPVESISGGAGVVTVRLSQPFAALPALLAHSSTAIVARGAIDQRGAVRAVIGTGPYRIVSIEPPQKVTVTAFEGWRGDSPEVTDIDYLAVGRAESRALIAESGQADLVYGLDRPAVDRLRGKGHHVQTATLPRTLILKLNSGHRWLSDVRTRQAISLAINRVGIARGLMRDADLAATQLFPPAVAGWHDPQVEPLRTDVERAHALLGEQGWRLGPDGVAVRGGERFALRLQTYTDRPELPALAAAVQDQLRRIGIAVTIEIANSGDIPLAHRDGTLELALAARNYAAVTDPTTTLRQDFTRRGGDWGAMNWPNADAEDALNGLLNTTDPARQRALRSRFVRALQSELPIIPIAWYTQVVASGVRIEGVTVDPLERSYRVSDLRWRPSDLSLRQGIR